jgi:arginine decarboxylase-like protein
MGDRSRVIKVERMQTIERVIAVRLVISPRCTVWIELRKQGVKNRQVTTGNETEYTTTNEIYDSVKYNFILANQS